MISEFSTLAQKEIFFDGKRVSEFKTHRICKIGMRRTIRVVKPLTRKTISANVIASNFLHHHKKHATLRAPEETIEF